MCIGLKMEDNSAHRPEGGVGNSSAVWLVRTLIRYACKPLLAVPFLLAYLVDLVIYIPVTAILRKGHSFTRAFGASDWADMSVMMFFSENAPVTLLIGSSAIAGALFGVIHCFAWNFFFPSNIERIMWRVASLTVIGSCLTAGFASLLRKLVAFEGNDRAALYFRSLYDLLLVCSMFLYPSSRICLLVLALTSLRSLPDSAFETVQWIELVPHI